MIGLGESDEKIRFLLILISEQKLLLWIIIPFLISKKVFALCGGVLCTLFHDPEKSKHLPCLPVGGWLELVCRTK